MVTHSRRTLFAGIFLCLLTTYNTALVWQIVRARELEALQSPKEHVYCEELSSKLLYPLSKFWAAYTGNDFPDNFPLHSPLPDVILLPEDTRHYPLYGPSAANEWASSNALGGAYVHLGPSNRFFSVSMLHQLHCLRYMRMALTTTEDPYATLAHVKHCLNYLRQAILCKPDLTLEDANWKKGGSYSARKGMPRVCKDWGQVYKEADANFLKWEAWKLTHRQHDNRTYMQ